MAHSELKQNQRQCLLAEKRGIDLNQINVKRNAEVRSIDPAQLMSLRGFEGFRPLS